jgi:hypothetical protein
MKGPMPIPVRADALIAKEAIDLVMQQATLPGTGR